MPLGSQSIRTLPLRTPIPPEVGVQLGADCICLSSRLLESGSLWSITLDTCDNIGETRRKVWLDSNGHGRIHAEVRYRVVPTAFSDPPALNLGIVNPHAAEPVSAMVELRTASEHSLDIVAVYCSDPQVQFDLQCSVIARDSPARLWARIEPRDSNGRIEAVMSVQLADPAFDAIRIPIVAEIVDGIASSCPEVLFSPFPLGACGEVTVQLHLEPGTSLRDVRSTNEGVQIASVTRSADRALIVLRTHRRLPLGLFGGNVRLNIDNGAIRDVSLPFRGRVLEAGQAQPFAGPAARSDSCPAQACISALGP